MNINQTDYHVTSNTTGFFIRQNEILIYKNKNLAEGPLFHVVEKLSLITKIFRALYRIRCSQFASSKLYVCDLSEPTGEKLIFILKKTGLFGSILLTTFKGDTICILKSKSFGGFKVLDSSKAELGLIRAEKRISLESEHMLYIGESSHAQLSPDGTVKIDENINPILKTAFACYCVAKHGRMFGYTTA